MNELKYVGVVKDGKLHIVNRKGFDADLTGFEGSRVLIGIKTYRKSRSTKQNAYYHSCVIPYVTDGLVEMGFDKHLLNNETVHELLKSKFLIEDVGIESGEYITLTKSTTDLSTTEFVDFIAAVQQWASEFLNIQIPDPGEQSEINY